ncbi:uncharacterized protein LOC123541063 [Mercenaria mercenaria]|uniref:uncharacterized protein LOC123541063 n=1 Tax=Mercenaria mercenaria TaxID=6596 RepID=UPI001E1DAF88|nr:uncharacterized protein LOC123541063 [Mercenaria mercenaria]
MMLKWLLVCFVAIAVAKWSLNVQADEQADELDEEEKRLLQGLEDAINQNKRQTGDDCDSMECFLDDECATQCCEEYCDGETDMTSCMEGCMDGGPLSKRMALAARNQESKNEEVNNNNKHDKKIFGIRIPPVPPVRRWVPPVRVPPVRRWVPPVRVPPVRVPPVRRWVPPTRRWFKK